MKDKGTRPIIIDGGDQGGAGWTARDSCHASHNQCIAAGETDPPGAVEASQVYESRVAAVAAASAEDNLFCVAPVMMQPDVVARPGQ